MCAAANDARRDLSSRFVPFFDQLECTSLAPWRSALEDLTRERLCAQRHGDLPGWQAALAALPSLGDGRPRLDAPCVGIEPVIPPSTAGLDALRRSLGALQPWRKGPFCLYGLHIDAEWRSDWKWARLANAIAPLPGRLVLDLGCGNGWYGYRALGAGAGLVLGIDPMLRAVMQFLAVDHYIADPRVAVLPLADVDLPSGLTGFDTVFSMGVLYHRRNAQDHLRLLRRLLRCGGQLVLETLILDAPGHAVLVPAARYARMRNVHALPTLVVLREWLASAGLRCIRVIDVTRTTIDEQRATSWMRFQSLRDFLDPADPRRTVEGYPAPTRAIVLAER
jgi:tRNA (mo5U34)-methyltransferase